MFLWLALLSASPLAASDKPVLPADIQAAKSIAVLVRMMGSPRNSTGDSIKRSEIESEIKKHSRFEIINDPDQADVVCVLVETPRIKGRGAYFQPDTLLLFRGGASPLRSAMPIWMRVEIGLNRSNISLLIDHLHHDVRAADAKATQSHADESGSEEELSKDDRDPQVEFPLELHSQKHAMAPEIYAAKSVILQCEGEVIFVNCGKDKIAKVIHEGGRWEVVTDPAKADLAFFWFHKRPVKGRGRYLYVTDYTVFFVFKAGSQPHWESIPLYTMSGPDPAPMVRHLLQEVGSAPGSTP